MQNPSPARAGRVLIPIFLALFALIAASCGGGSDSAAADADGEPAASADDTDIADGDQDDAGEVPDDGPEPTPFVAPTPEQNRDCVHDVQLLADADGDEDGDEDDAEEPVELPPASKPEIDQDLLGEVGDELIVTDLIVGTGEEAIAGSTVSMQYVGVLAEDGTEFDSSWDRGAQPFEFTLSLGEVIAGWDLGIEGMNVGGRRVLQIPSDLAYGDQPRGEVIGADADLLFIVDLVGIVPPPEAAPPVPEDTLGSFDKLGIIDLVEGSGCTAELGDIIAVHYVGVDATDGTEFDSSWGRGSTFQLTAGKAQVIDGWNEGLVGMKVGGERILQIPAELAYGDNDLVFRVHLEVLVEGPYAHTVTFDGDAPTEVETTTITEGTGDGAENGDIVDANIAVLFWKSDQLIQSTWESGQTAQLALQPEALLPGLNEAVIGIKAGELRQIVLPPDVAYPDGVPPDAGLDDDDALVFIVQPVRIIEG